MCLSGRVLVVGSYVPFCWEFGVRQLRAFQVGVGGRQLCALLVGDCW
jgi:hypothetical protein